MISLCLGITAFALYFLYDVNSFLWQRRLPRTFFAAGTLLLAAALALDIVNAALLRAFSVAGDWLWLLAAAAMFAALIYSLFFALPFEATYQTQENGRHVYDKGVYALCRHPGILFFFMTMLALGLAALPYTGLLTRGMLFSAMNLAYAAFQDRVTFPKTFCDYPAYRQRIPFLIPTKESIRLALHTLRRTDDEEANT